MEFFALIVAILLDEISWHLQAVEAEENAMAEVEAEMAFENWLRYNDYPDHW